MIRDQRLGPHLARRHITAEHLPARTQILNFSAVFGRKIERSFRKLFITDGNAEARAELAKLLFIELFLLVRDVSSLAAFAEAITLNRSRKNDGRRTL